MLIHLKRNERLFINGAVIRLDRRGTIELMNDAQFLLENHIMQVENATTPLRQLYFIVQTMIMDPDNAHLTKALFDTNAKQLEALSSTGKYVELIKCTKQLVENEAYFEVLKELRRAFAMEDAILGEAKPKFNERANAA